MQQFVTYFCPQCRKTSVADRDADGFPICPRCQDRASEQGSDLYSPTVKRIMRDWRAGKFEPR